MAARRKQDEAAKPKQQKANIYEERTYAGVEDMVLLTDISDNGIVENLNARLKASEIYTYIGSVLVVCNPYKWLKIYDNDTIMKYPFRQQTDASPHIFYTAESAYRSLITEEENQCIIVSGESGAGKTETSKQIQSYIAAVCGGGEGVDKLKTVFLNSNPVLEAFGNAKTLRNNNSSRFGKYFELKFNRAGNPKGGVITNYLLEKSRIVRPSLGERGFHIFYQLIASKYSNALRLGPANTFEYLRCSECYTVDDTSDAKDFESTVQALRSVGMNDADIDAIMAIVGAILHLGNVSFVDAKGIGNAEGSALKDKTAVTEFARLLRLDAEKVAFVLTHYELDTTRAGVRDVSHSSQNPVQAADRRDALARSLYERLFNMIVARINAELDPDQITQGRDELVSIGVLDIYGFEIFEKNGFEQLCINYVNEKLQQIFIELTLRAEQDEYEREGIQWTPIPFFNNRVVCELLDGAQPPGLFRILDDVCRTKHSVLDTSELDAKMLTDAAQIHKAHPHYVPLTAAFTVRHYAGEVNYQTGLFGYTNKDSLKNDLVNLLKSSGIAMIGTKLYTSEDGVDLKTTATAGTRIRTQCQALVDALMDCQPHYVRCVKSNDSKKALFIDKARVLHQAKYLGLAENIKVRRAGFAYRCEYNKFLDRFCFLSPRTYPDWKGSDGDGCRAIIEAVKSQIKSIKGGEVQFGKTIIFIRTPETYFALNQLRKEKINVIPIPIQRCWRRYTAKLAINALPGEMSDLYSKNNKTRNRNSIFRDYDGSYLGGMAEQLANKILDGVYRIVDFYNKDEGIKYIDSDGYQIVKSESAPFWIKAPRILVLTEVAIYIMEVLSKAAKQKISRTKAMPDIVLRRRIVLKAKGSDSYGVLESWNMSLLSDGLVALYVKPVARIADPKLFPHPTWPQKTAVQKCQRTGVGFSFMPGSKKRCKVTGAVMVLSVCDTLQSIPDYGYYEPNRVSDGYYGLMSCDQVEDLLIGSQKKTEFLGLFLKEWQKLYETQNVLKFANTNMFNLRVGPDPKTSQVPAAKVQLTTDRSMLDENVLVGAVDDPIQRNVLTLKVAEGIPERIVEARRKRQLEKIQRDLAERKQRDAERKVRAQQRDLESEKNRVIRQQEKRTANAARKEENKAAFKANSTVNAKLATAPNGKR